jgi:hypothetical protein
MAMLVHADEAGKAGGVYIGEQYTLADLTLWQDVPQWADLDSTQADNCMLANSKPASIHL